MSGGKNRFPFACSLKHTPQTSQVYCSVFWINQGNVRQQQKVYKGLKWRWLIRTEVSMPKRL